MMFGGSLLCRAITAIFKASLIISVTQELYNGSLPVFTRASSATYINNADLQVVAAATVSRHTGKGILIEKAATNICLYSNDFSNWTNTVAAPTKNATGIDGSTSAWTLTDSSTTGFASINKIITVPNDSLTRTLQVKIKKTTGGTSPTFGINYYYSGGTLISKTPRINTDTGAVSFATGVTVTSLVGWWLVTIPLGNNSSGNTNLVVALYPATAPYGGGGDVVTAMGSAICQQVQVETDGIATTYIDTTTAALSRNGDVLLKGSSNIDGGKFLVQIEYTPVNISSTDTVYVFGSYTDANNFWGLFHIGNSWIWQKKIAGVTYNATLTAGTTYKIAAVNNDNGLAFAINGNAGIKNSNGLAMVMASNVEIGSINSLYQGSGSFRNINIFNGVVPDSKLIGLSL